MSHGEPAATTGAGNNPYGGRDYYCDCSLGSDANDGTTSALAVKDIQALFNNSHANVTLTGGDRVFIRSHDGTSDITHTLTAQISSPADYTNRVDFIVDDGTVWANEGYFIISWGAYANFYTGRNVSLIGSVHSVNSDQTWRFVTTTSTDRYFDIRGDNGYSRWRNLHFDSDLSQATRGLHMRCYQSEYSKILIENILYEGLCWELSIAHCPLEIYRCIFSEVIVDNFAIGDPVSLGLTDASAVAVLEIDRYEGMSFCLKNVDWSFLKAACPIASMVRLLRRRTLTSGQRSLLSISIMFLLLGILETY